MKKTRRAFINMSAKVPVISHPLYQIGERLLTNDKPHPLRILICASDFLVLPSIKGEGLPKVVIEAMAQSIVPIASNVGGCPELIEDGISGLITTPKSPQSMALAIKEVLQSKEKAKEMGKKLRSGLSLIFMSR